MKERGRERESLYVDVLFFHDSADSGKQKKKKVMRLEKNQIPDG